MKEAFIAHCGPELVPCHFRGCNQQPTKHRIIHQPDSGSAAPGLQEHHGGDVYRLKGVLTTRRL